MAMNGNTLGALIKAKLEARGLALAPDALDYFEAVGEAVVEHIQNAAVVNVPVEPTDAGLQSTAGTPPAPTLAPVVATALDGTIS